MKITGQLLKQKREEKGVSINEVAVGTKINVRALMAMEAGDTENLPPKTFLRGFVHAYASYLDLDVEKVMNTFYEEVGSTKPKGPITEAPNRERSAPNEADDAINPKTSVTKTIFGVLGILILVVLIVLFKDKMESYEREAITEVPSGITSLNPPPVGETGSGGGAPTDPSTDGALPGPTPDAGAVVALSPSPSPTPENEAAAAAASPTPTPEPSPSPTATPTPQPSPSPSPTATSKPSPSPSPTATPKPSPSPSPTATPKPSPSPSPTATPKPSPSPSPTATPKPSPSPSPTATPKPSPSPTATPTSPAVGAQEIIIEALDNVDVDAQIDGEPAKKIRLRSDQVHSIRARRKVVLRLSDGGAVNLIVNGVERGVPGDLGTPLRVSLP